MWQHRHWPFNSRFQCCHILAHSSNAALPRRTALPEIPQKWIKQKQNQMCRSTPVLSSTLVFHPLSRVEKKGEKGQSNKKGQQMEGGGEPELSHVTSVDRLTGTPPRAHPKRRENIWRFNSLVSAFFVSFKNTTKCFTALSTFFVQKKSNIYIFLKKEIK